MPFNEQDTIFMNLAFEQAIAAKNRGDVPIGAVLTIDREIIAEGGNNQVTNLDYCSHAESLLIRDNASKIKQAHKEGKKIELYTTLEPCIMCFGTAVQNRINRIIFSCPDPVGGATTFEPTTDWLRKRWPIVEGNFLKEKSYNLLVKYMQERAEEWGRVLIEFEKMNNL